MSGQQYAPAAIYPGKDPVPILQEAGWALGPVWTGEKSRPHRDSIPDRPARSSVVIPTELPGLRREKGYSLETFCGLSTFSYVRVPGDIKNNFKGSCMEERFGNDGIELKKFQTAPFTKLMQ